MSGQRKLCDRDAGRKRRSAAMREKHDLARPEFLPPAGHSMVFAAARSARTVERGLLEVIVRRSFHANSLVIQSVNIIYKVH